MFTWAEVCTIIKTENGIEWPLVSKELNQKFQQGLYQLIYEGKVIKNGCFGEGKTKKINMRIAAYRNMINSLNKTRMGLKGKNGSFKTIDVLDKNLKVGDKVIMRAIALPDTKLDKNNVPWKVDLYALEDFLKNKHKDTIWLT